jgi:hypothetical protein
MDDEKNYNISTDRDRTQAPQELGLEDNNRWVQSRADVACIYDAATFQTIEEALPCKPSVDKSLFRPRYREIGAAYIFHCRKKAEEAKFKQERKQLDSAAAAVDQALREVGEFDYFGAGRWIPKVASKGTKPSLQLQFFQSNGLNVHDLLIRARDAIPQRKSGQPKRTVPALKGLLDLWHEATGKSALSKNRPSESSDDECQELFQEFEKFARAFLAPLRDAGFVVPDPKTNQAAKLLNRRRKPRRRKR